MKFLLQILLLILTWFTSQVYATPVYTKVACTSYEHSFSNIESLKKESEVKIGVAHFARSGILENIYVSKSTSRERYVSEYSGREEKIKELTGAVNWLPVFKNKLLSRVQNSVGFTLKHTDAEITQIIKKGKELGLTDDVIDDMLFISCRDAKPIASTDLVQQIDNYVNVVLKQGHPYKFTDIGQFNNFKNELKTGLKDIGVSTADVRIQGSSLRTPNANDVDLAAIISETDFDNLLKSFYNGKITKNNLTIDLSDMSNVQLKALSDDIIQNPSLYNRIAKDDFSYNYTKKIINAKPDKGVVEGLKSLKNSIQINYPNLNVENIAIQTQSGVFDLKPYIKL
ncbi:hypothetical protein FLACOL_01503 [Flavobacterium columnare]|uniref:Uncharacterized protein n=2 Tax=Flavobacterium TaxID=237 RepID=A0ABW8PLK2_9FLAO|nr:hypothetical protein [Flavobacterium columnare]SPE77508.1 hypothetical protein FLACOL_01503 [Flavobacterium columnare]